VAADWHELMLPQRTMQPSIYLFISALTLTTPATQIKKKQNASQR